MQDRKHGGCDSLLCTEDPAIKIPPSLQTLHFGTAHLITNVPLRTKPNVVKLLVEHDIDVNTTSNSQKDIRYCGGKGNVRLTWLSTIEDFVREETSRKHVTPLYFVEQSQTGSLVGT